jgi:hypothetical protein
VLISSHFESHPIVRDGTNIGEWALKNGLTEGRTKDFKLSKGKSIPIRMAR